MKKFLPKVGGKKPPQEPQGRITTDTLAEHRERVLAGGRKFKYPVQYQRHKLVINTIIIAVVAVLVMVTLVWYLLYQAQNTSNFIYRVTKVIPAPVASIDNENVRYSDYLMKYRGAAHYLLSVQRIDDSSDDGQRQLQDIKRGELNNAIADAYAVKLGRELKVSVSDAELESYLIQQRQTGEGEVSEATYRTVIRDYYDWSFDEYIEVMKSKLLRKKVSYAIDVVAETTADSISSEINGKNNPDLKALADKVNADNPESVVYFPATWVPRTNQDHGLAEAAAKLKKGQVSEPITTASLSGEGYYFVKLVDSNDTSIRYEYIFVSLNEFTKRLDKAEKDGKLKTYITIGNVEE